MTHKWTPHKDNICGKGERLTTDTHSYFVYEGYAQMQHWLIQQIRHDDSWLVMAKEILKSKHKSFKTMDDAKRAVEEYDRKHNNKSQ